VDEGTGKDKKRARQGKVEMVPYALKFLSHYSSQAKGGQRGQHGEVKKKYCGTGRAGKESRGTMATGRD